MGPKIESEAGLECGGTVDTLDQRLESEVVWWDCRHVGPETGKRVSVVGLSDTWDQTLESELVWWDCQTRGTRDWKAS